MSKEKKILGYIGTLFQILGRAKIGVGEKQDLHQSSFPYFFSILRDTIFCTDSVLQENPILVVVENSSLQIAFVVLKLAFLLPKDYGRPMKPFFIEIPNFLAWADNLGRLILGHLGYFWPIYQHPIWYCESLSMFSNIKKLRLYIPYVYL